MVCRRHVAKVNVNDKNTGEVNSNDKNIGEVNSNDENIWKVNGDDKNIKKVDNQRDKFANQTYKTNHFEDERRDNFVSNTCDDENIKAVNTCERNTEGVNQRITFKTAEQTCDHDGRKTNQHNLKSRLNKDPWYPSDNG